MCLGTGGRPVTTVAYIANQFPSPLEPYVMDEISELRRRGVRVICCSGKETPSNERPINELSAAERAFRDEARFLWPLSPPKLAQAAHRVGSDRRALRPVLASRAPGRQRISQPASPRSRPHSARDRPGQRTGAPGGGTYPRSPRILRFLDGPGGGAAARNRVQPYAARFRSAAARSSAGRQVALLPVLRHRLQLQPRLHSPSFPFDPGIKSPCPAPGCRLRSTLGPSGACAG